MSAPAATAPTPSSGFTVWLARLKPDTFTLLLVGTVALASVLPAKGAMITASNGATDVAVFLLFFLYGARLSREAVIGGLTQWRLHLLVTLCTFVLFPLVGLALRPLVNLGVLTPDLYLGVLFLCTLPSTVQSSIAFTSIAGGNVAAAICSASASNLLGMVITPVLVGLLLAKAGAGFSADALTSVFVQLLLPFVLGQLLRSRIGAWVARNKKVLGPVDRASILLVVYGAFSHAVNEGIWHQLDAVSLLKVVLVNIGLLALILTLTTVVSRRLHLSRGDEIAVVFCGSKKSLVSGIPMANVLFAGHTIGMIVLPLMLFHQIQLMVCAVLARRYAASHPPGHVVAE
ncbi:bile acid:sodium symporter family protein [Azospirillum sp. B4]|uniref:bile acid:sodium symporter family protein n=1 Tax=Azospirillum sp. B4 TaxID=95605 RepID=UPI00034AAEE4|nr:bile acid:sodium symporter family protein [Azospirillum sp. B4]